MQPFLAPGSGINCWLGPSPGLVFTGLFFLHRNGAGHKQDVRRKAIVFSVSLHMQRQRASAHEAAGGFRV